MTLDNGINKNIIIVEDSKTQLYVLMQMLKEDPRNSIRIAQNGKEALSLIKIQKPDLVLSDILMPEMNGFELTKTIKGDNKLKDVPVILLTALMGPADIIEGLESGADVFLVKPVSKDELLRCINSLKIEKLSKFDKRPGIGLKIYFGGQEYLINESKLQIISLLFDTIKKVHNTNIELIDNEKNIKKLFNELARNEERFRILFESSSDAIVICNLNGCYLDVNPAYLKIFGYDSKEELLQTRLPEELLFFEKYKNMSIDNFIEREICKKDNSKITAELRFSKIFDSESNQYFQIIIRDITERKIKDDKIKHLSFHDYLTGLYNRAFFEEEINRLDNERKLPLGIIFGDMDNLKLINDKFGHTAGDNSLKLVAGVLLDSTRRGDILARWGGDEFGLLLPKTSKEEVSSVVNRILENMKKANINNITLSISLGFAVKEKINEDINTTIANAEKLMYDNKLFNKNML